MALKHPVQDKVLELCFVVCESLCVVGDALGCINDLSFTGFDVANKIRGWVFLMFASEDNGGIPISSSGLDRLE